jgi:hypothetical protein
MLCDDPIQTHISSDGIRRFSINEQLLIEQSADKLVFDALIFPVLVCEKHQTTFAIHRFEITR